MNLKTFILSMLSGDDGLGISSKRVVSFIAFFSIVIIAFVHLFTGYTIAEFIFDGLMYIVIAGFFFNAIEAFSKRSGKSPTTNVNIRDTQNVVVQPEQPVAEDVAHELTTVSQSVATENEKAKLQPNEIIG